MFLRRFSWLAALVFLLAGCSQPQAAQPTTPALIPTVALPTQTPASVVAQMETATPTPSGATSALTATVPATPTAPAGTAYPPPGAAVTATIASYPYPYPGTGQPTAATQVTPKSVLPGATAAGQPSAPFKDCARTPGLMGCDPQAAALAAHLAFADPSAKRVVALDLQNGQGWQLPLLPTWLEWSPGGKKLLVAWGDQNYSVYTAQGQPEQSFTPPQGTMSQPAWLPDSSLSLDGTTVSADGTQARLEYTQDMNWRLHVKPTQGQEQVIALEPQPTDRLYQMVGWVPGTQKLLVQRYYGSNGAMLVGGEVMLVDTASRTVQSLNVTAPLNTGADFSWQPGAAGKPGLLAFIVSGGNGGQPMGTRQLALWDAASNQIRYPLPGGINVNGLDWRPDGARLTFSAALAETATAEAKKVVPGAGIYQLDPASNAVETLVASPQSAADYWPHWTADGQTLVYARAITPASGSPSAQIRARQGTKDWSLVEGLPAPEGLFIEGEAAWRTVVAFGK